MMKPRVLSPKLRACTTQVLKSMVDSLRAMPRGQTNLRKLIEAEIVRREGAAR